MTHKTLGIASVWWLLATWFGAIGLMGVRLLFLNYPAMLAALGLAFVGGWFLERA